MDKQRYRSGPVSEVKSVIKVGVAAEVGDLAFLTVTAGAGVVDNVTSLATTAALAADKFLGILVQGATRGTETTATPCLVYTAGEFEMDLAAAAAAVLPIGTLVGVGTGDQIVTATGVLIADAIGRLARPIAVGDLTALVAIQSVVMGGPQAAA